MVADRGYDSDPMRLRLRRRGIDLIAPYRCNSILRQYEDKRKLRRYRKRWKIERSIAWVQNFRRVYVRYDHSHRVFGLFVLRVLVDCAQAFMKPALDPSASLRSASG